MRATLLVVFIGALACGIVGAGEAKDKLMADQQPHATVGEISPEWLGAIERLRLLPRPGEIKGAGFVANLTAVYGLPEETSAKCEAVQKEYDDAVLKLAAKWEQDVKALRAEYEPKLLQNLSQDKRDAAKKVLDASNAHWVTPYDRETGFRNEFAKRSAELRESKLKITVEAYEEAKSKLQAWVKETRAKLIQRDEEYKKQLRELLGAENAARFDAIANPKKAAEPKPETGKPKGAAEKK